MFHGVSRETVEGHHISSFRLPVIPPLNIKPYQIAVQFPFFAGTLLKAYLMLPNKAISIAEDSFKLSLSDEQVSLLKQYVNLLTDWSARVRLISRNDRNFIWERHVLDCLSFVPHIPKDGPLLDLGSGAGLPGIIVKIMRPDLEVYLLEPARMKSLFLSETIAVLGLSNTFAIRARAEALAENSSFLGKFQIGTARAVARLPQVWDWIEPLLASNGVLISMKGPGALNEFRHGVPNYLCATETTLTIPFSRRIRSFVFLRRCFT